MGLAAGRAAGLRLLALALRSCRLQAAQRTQSGIGRARAEVPTLRIVVTQNRCRFFYGTVHRSTPGRRNACGAPCTVHRGAWRALRATLTACVLC
eukprot:COSAG01_NODE_3821_length_5636_cov_28.570838_3_plen_95_part_00